jgi:5-(carboxyamino)imidazole ribonucleotide synthase
MNSSISKLQVMENPDPRSSVILPDSTLGVLGGGQLGRMFAQAAQRMGYRVAVLEPSADSPCGQIAQHVITTAYDDATGLAELARHSRAITYEFENVSAKAVEFLESQGKPLRPGSRALRITQDRWLEKSFLLENQLPVTGFGLATTADELKKTLQQFRLPGFLKTSRGGYDGKGQMSVATAESAEIARRSFAGAALIYEEKVDFDLELSVVACRSVAGQVVAFPPFENEHRNHILDRTFFPGRISAAMATEAIELAKQVGRQLDFVGTYCVEMFAHQDGNLVINEIAPRPHNSGHLTLNACSVSQFDLQVRALCGLSLPEPELLRPAIMLNLVGDGMGDNLLGIPEALALPNVFLHLYGKTKAPKGRKMGHVTVTGSDLASAAKTVEKVQKLLSWG